MMLLANQVTRGFDEAAAVINALLFGAAVGWNLAAARVALWPARRVQHAIVAALSVGYVAAYLILVITNVQPADWSSVMRGFGWVAVLFVYIIPAVVTHRQATAHHNRFLEAINAEILRIAREDGTET